MLAEPARPSPQGRRTFTAVPTLTRLVWLFVGLHRLRLLRGGYTRRTQLTQPGLPSAVLPTGGKVGA